MLIYVSFETRCVDADGQLIAAELGETANGSDHYRALFTLGIMLFAVTFAINLTADLIVRGIRKR